MLETVDADRVGEFGGQAQEELAFGDGAGDHLVGHEGPGAGFGVEAVAQLRVAEHEDALGGNEDMVEDRDGVHFLIAGRERLVVGAAAVVQRGAAQVAQARRVVGDGEGVGVRGVLRRAAEHRGGEDEQLVRDRGDGGQHPGAVDDDAVPALLDNPGRQLAAELLGAGDGAVDLRRDHRVRGEDIVFPCPLVVVADVLTERGTGLGKPLPGGAECGERGVHVVPGTAQEAIGGLGPGRNGTAAALKVLNGLRHQEGGVDEAATGGRGVRQRILVFRVMLHVEEPRVGARHVAERGVSGDLFADNLTVDHHVGSHGIEFVQVLLSGTDTHCCLSSRR